MTFEERKALMMGGIIIGKIAYRNATNVVLLPNFLLKFDLSSFPDMKTHDEIFRHTATNTTILTFCGKDIGLRFMRDSIKGDDLSVSLSHPASKYLLSILQPIWDEQNKGKCETCHGSGWDGMGYTLGCIDCGGSGKKRT